MKYTIQSQYAYLLIQIPSSSHASKDALLFRKALQDSLAQTFGASAAGTYVDVLQFQHPAHSKDKEEHNLNATEESRPKSGTRALIRVAFE